MSGPLRADVRAIGMVTAVGLGAVETAASVRAGIAGYRETPFLDADGQPIVMGCVPDDQLPALVKAVAKRFKGTDREEHIVRLGGAAIAECLAGIEGAEQIPVLLAGPEEGLPPEPDLFQSLAWQSKIAFDRARSRVFPAGRAGGFLALQEGIRRIAEGESALVVVGGADSYFDEDVLGALDTEERLRVEAGGDGFIPGEAGAFLLLAAAGAPGPAPIASIDAVALAEEPGHLYSEVPYRGEGLDAAFRAVLAAKTAPEEPMRTIYAGLNGEHFGAKEWGVAALRSKDRLLPGFRLEHPIDCTGDPGAALAPMLLGLAAIGMQRGYRRSPALVFCSSDRELRGAAIISNARGGD